MIETAREMAAATGGVVVAGREDAIATSVVIDSREVEPGAAFVAFRGEKSDGRRFVQDALSRGARVVVVSDEDEALRSAVEAAAGAPALVRVAEPTAALQALAAHHRRHLTCPVVGVTGSSGKTTTKDLLRSVLATSLEVVATEGNRNNELGVPLTILAAGPETGALIVEMAMRGAGQIAELCAMAAPTAGLVTNVGQTHLELLGSERAIADAKAELVRAIPAGGRVFLNGDDTWAPMMAAMSAAPVTYYGTGASADVRARDIATDEEGRPSFTLETPAGAAQVSLRVPGRHNAYNAAAAAAVALHLGLALEEIAAGLASAQVSGMRMEVLETADGVTIVNDSYNANPTSMRAALRTLADFAVEGQRVAVLGDMAELGSYTELAHFDLGEHVAALGLDRLVTVGEKAARIGDGAVAAGMTPDRVERCADAECAVGYLGSMLHAGDVVLVKASRVMELEKVVEGLTDTDA